VCNRFSRVVLVDDDTTEHAGEMEASVPTVAYRAAHSEHKVNEKR